MRHTAEAASGRPPAARLGDRSLFPHLAPLVYLNHAAISPPSRPVRQAMLALLDDYAAQGAAAFPAWFAQRVGLRAKLGRLIGAEAQADDIALIQSTTRGISDVALCFPWRPRDRVILFEGEFPANVTPWQRAAALFDLEIVLLPLGGFADGSGAGLARLADELRRGARLVSVSAVQFQTGLRMPLAAIGALCREHGAELCVDAVQAVGATPVDVEAAGIDYLACGGHKWLMGLEGTGFLYIRRERAPALRPAVAGWLSHEDGVGFLLRGPGHLRYDRPIRQRADFVEGGNLNAAGFAGLEAAVDLILSIGVARIHEHANRYLDPLEAGLRERGFESLRAADPALRSCALGVRPPAGAPVVELHRELMGLGIACSIPDGVLRFAPHWPNALDEVEQVLLSVDEALARVRKG
ncbi:class V aminotransferase [Sorangium cellulosum]|uniref:Class V aminotransferase n=1 Tax=Sorangium cellulosum TaxID=56 RepID=A0A4P2QAX6_SORCE|nr:aminotransferase class V-fold PLP-dependent enzyme [Sorangium cellulosum]AUX26739.1 class V aminotransferase [Sorangium cellulosum]